MKEKYFQQNHLIPFSNPVKLKTCISRLGAWAFDPNRIFLIPCLNDDACLVPGLSHCSLALQLALHAYLFLKNESQKIKIQGFVLAMAFLINLVPSLPLQWDQNHEMFSLSKRWPSCFPMFTQEPWYHSEHSSPPPIPSPAFPPLFTDTMRPY